MPFPVDTVDGLFHDGNPATNTPGTVIDAAWLNAVQAMVIAMGQFTRTITTDIPIIGVLTEIIDNNDGVLFCNTVGGDYFLSLPVSASLSANRRYIIKNITPPATANTLKLVASDGKTIDLQAQIDLMGREQITVCYDGTNWESI